MMPSVRFAVASFGCLRTNNSRQTALVCAGVELTQRTGRNPSYHYLSLGCSRTAEQRMLQFARSQVGKPFSNMGMARALFFPRKTHQQDWCANPTLRTTTGSLPLTPPTLATGFVPSWWRPSCSRVDYCTPPAPCPKCQSHSLYTQPTVFRSCAQVSRFKPGCSDATFAVQTVFATGGRDGQPVRASNADVASAHHLRPGVDGCGSRRRDVPLVAPGGRRAQRVAAARHLSAAGWRSARQRQPWYQTLA